MFRWLIILFVSAGCLGGLTAARAQDNPWSGEPGRFTPWDGNGAWAPYGGYPGMSTPYGSRYSPYSADPPLTPPNAPYVEYGADPQPQTIYEYLPPGDVRGPWWETSPGGLRLARALERSWFRIDYLNWHLTDPGEDLIGAEWINANARDPINGYGPIGAGASAIPLARNRDGTVRTDIGNAFLFVGEASDLSGFDFRHRNGARLNFGFPTEVGAVEANLWTLQKHSESFRVVPTFDPSGLFLILPAIPLTNNGSLVNPTFDAVAPMILFDQFMHVEYGQEMYGAEVNYFRKAVRNNDNLRIDLLGGVKFIRLNEEMLVTGTDLQQQVSPEIFAASTNYLFGPSAGVRVEWEYGIVKLGADARFTAAFDRHHNVVRTRELFRFPPDADGNQPVSDPTNSDDDHTDFSPISDLKFYAQVQVTHRLKVRVGYDFLNLFNVSRPHNAIVWDDSGIANGPVLIKADATNLEHFRASGLFVGGELSLY